MQKKRFEYTRRGGHITIGFDAKNVKDAQSFIEPELESIGEKFSPERLREVKNIGLKRPNVQKLL